MPRIKNLWSTMLFVYLLDMLLLVVRDVDGHGVVTQWFHFVDCQVLVRMLTDHILIAWNDNKPFFTFLNNSIFTICFFIEVSFVETKKSQDLIFSKRNRNEDTGVWCINPVFYINTLSLSHTHTLSLKHTTSLHNVISLPSLSFSVFYTH